jgi:hypothetical protein
MKKRLWILMVLLALTLSARLVNAQEQPAQPATPAPPKINQPLPFKAGEKLYYEVSFTKLIFGGVIGDVILSIANAESATKNPQLVLKAELKSKGFFPKFFGLKVRDTYSSVVNAQDMGLQESHKSIEEGKKRLDQKSLIDRDAGRVIFTERNLADSKAEPKTKEAPSPTWIQDVLSATYFVRTQPLNEGDVIQIPISDNGQIYQIEVVVEKREEVKVDAGKFKAIRLNVKVFDGRFIHRSGEMLLWMSDDGRRIPVQSKIKFSGANVTLNLKKTN